MTDDHGACQAQAQRCPLCMIGSGKPWLVKNGFPILRCGDCRNAFLSTTAIPADLEKLYSREYFEGNETSGYPRYLADSALLERNFARRIKWIEALQPRGRLLEIGAAYGLFLKTARARGWDAMGVEIATECAAAASRIAAVPVVAGDFLSVSLPGRFDVIAMFDVIEHMRDPMACIRRARELLAPRGMLVIETGNIASPWARLLGGSWYFIDPPQHLCYFTAAGLEAAARRCGFRGEARLRRLGRWVSLSNIAFKLAHQVPGVPFRRLFAALANGRLPGAVYLNFGDGMLMAIRREQASGQTTKEPPCPR